jgi:kynurenine formamidase
MRLIDLSHKLEPGMPSYPGLPEPKFQTFLSRHDAPRQKSYSPGTTFEIASYELGGNTGTYVDAPFHRHADGPDLAGVPLERVANLDGIVIDSANDGATGASAIAPFDVKGKAVLFRSGWSSRWGGDYFRSGPYLPAETCNALVEAGAALVGIDCANIDNMLDPSRPAHTILLRAGIPIVEHLTNLVALPRAGFRFFAVPPAIAGGTSFPVRAFALLP